MQSGRDFFLLLATAAQLHLDVAQSAVRYNGMPHTHTNTSKQKKKKLSCSTCRLIEKRMSLVNRSVAMNCFPFRFDYLHSAPLPFSICSPLFLLLISHLASEGSPPPTVCHKKCKICIAPIKRSFRQNGKKMVEMK